MRLAYSWLAAVVVMTSLVFVMTPTTDAYVTTFPEEPDIDGIRMY